MAGQWARCAAVVACAMAALADPAWAAFFPIGPATDLIYDGQRKVVYLPQLNGLVQRYDETTRKLLSPLDVGVSSVGGADLTPDGRYLLVTGSNLTFNNGAVHRIDLDTGAVAHLSYPLVNGETEGSFDVAALSNGTAVFTGGGFELTNSTVRQIDLTTWTISALQVGGQPQAFTARSHIFRSRDRGTAFIAGGDSRGGNLWGYSASANAFAFKTTAAAAPSNLTAGLSPDGGLIAMTYNPFVFPPQGTIRRGSDFGTVTSIGPFEGGLAFDPTGTLAYVVPAAADSNIHILRTSDWQQVSQFSSGTQLFGGLGGKTLTVGDDGEWLYFRNSSGLYTFDITPAPEPRTAGLLVTLGAAALIRRPKRGAGSPPVTLRTLAL